MSFNLFTSNKLENLSEQLCRTLDRPLSNPLGAEIIVVQSKGMERWLSLELASRQGICANIRFPFPNHFIYDILRMVFPDLPQKSIFDPRILTWRVMKLLPECLDRPAFADLKAYLNTPGTDIKQVQLATRIADLYDQYLLFRPELVLGWEEGQDADWQAQLWREVIKGHEEGHRAALGQRLVRVLASQDAPVGFPQRVSVFGISALPQYHMQVFDALSHHIEINLFLMNPCREYWGDIVSDAEISRAVRKQKKKHGSLDLFHYEHGNVLLSTLGKLGRDFFDLIEGFDCQKFEVFGEPGSDTLLAGLQSDILNLKDRSLTSMRKQTIAAEDSSIQLHACHSRRREIEVLQDSLLGFFDANPDLKPGDVLVMMPDVEPYVPYIQSVFDLPPDDARRIPFSISDRNFNRENEIIDVFLAIMDLAGGRFGAAEVIKILESAAVQRRFDVDEDDLSLIQDWVRDSRIRWGIDAKNREQLGLPALSENTWRAGLDRMLLGYAMPAGEQSLYDGKILPYDHIEGSQAPVLGKLLDFTQALFGQCESLAKERTLQQWQSDLNDLLEAFFHDDDKTTYEAQAILHALAELEDYQNLTEFDSPLGLAEIKQHLEIRLGREGHGYGFLSGGVTFCSMLPMRSIPAKVICLVGMNGDAYPRMVQHLAFDLIAQAPRRGDRSRRSDDRYLFLEALLSARERLYISYIGQSIKDNSLIPPSVLVSELLNTIAANYEMKDQDLARALTTIHRLQAFSPAYFAPDSGMFSYSRENLAAARESLEPGRIPLSFLGEGLPEPGDELREVTLEELYRFFRNPARYLLNRRLNLFLKEDYPVLEEKENFYLLGLDKYHTAQMLVAHQKDKGEVAALKASTLASGRLSHGAVGELEFDTLAAKVAHFVKMTERFTAGGSRDPVDVDISVNAFRITGRIEPLHAEGLMLSRFAKIRAKDHLKAWIYHLVLNSIAGPGFPARSFLTGVDSGRDGNWQGWAYAPIANPTSILASLLDIYWQGLIRPIHFFPEASLTYMTRREESWRPESALNSAKMTWEGSSRERGEKEDGYFHLCFGKATGMLDNAFQEMAETVYSALMDNRKPL